MSRSTVLRLVEELPDPVPPAPRVVGVDEYATRKSRAYGTVLVDAETRRPVDLLPDRKASSLAAWPTAEAASRTAGRWFTRRSTRVRPRW
ncbi:hypothetical protein ACFU7Y_43760 [Kitasatospora sp. NPDC057542]|uniref:hypothetical protein n=1 Tax=Kitasatospora sp. NPDC057542 TaxID=3346162 RepID=UPI0036C9BDF0